MSDVSRETDGPPEPGPDWCYPCNRSEPIPAGGCYQICGECMHCFVTEQDLVNATRKMQVEIGMSHGETEVLPILFCPLCVHDF